MIKDGWAAFPALNFIVPSDLEQRHVHRLGETQGMTLRDYFAAKAMQAFVIIGKDSPKYGCELTAEDSYKQADAMLAEREREK